MKRFNHAALASLAALAFCAVSCNHKPLWYGNDLFAYTEVIFNWSRTTGTKAAGVPESQVMDFYLYPEDGSLPIYNQTPHDGGIVRAPYGNYFAVAYNNDTGALRVRNTDSASTLELYTRDEGILAPMGIATKVDLRAKAAADERVVLSPEYVWAGRMDGFDVVFSDHIRSHTVYMEDAWVFIDVEVRGVKNFNYLSSISCALSGLAESYFPGKGQLSNGLVTIPFSGVKMDAQSVAAMRSKAVEDEKDSVFGELVCFGHCPVKVNSHFLTLYAVLTNGEKFMFTFDVTEQMHHQEDPQHIHLLIEDLPVPTPITTGGGMSLSMDSWQGVDVDITMK